MPKYQRLKLTFYFLFKSVLPKGITKTCIWLCFHRVYLIYFKILSSIIFILESCKKCALRARAILLILDMLSNSEYLIFVIKLNWNLMTKLLKFASCPLKQMFWMSHLTWFEFEMYIKFLVGSCNNYVSRSYLMKYLPD